MGKSPVSYVLHGWTVVPNRVLKTKNLGAWLRRYLGTSAVKVFLVCSAVWGLLRLARAATGSRAGPSDRADRPPWQEEEGGMPSPPGPTPAAEQHSGDGAPVGDTGGGRPERRAGWHVGFAAGNCLSEQVLSTWA